MVEKFDETFYIKWQHPNPAVSSKTKIININSNYKDKSDFRFPDISDGQAVDPS